MENPKRSWFNLVTEGPQASALSLELNPTPDRDTYDRVSMTGDHIERTWSGGVRGLEQTSSNGHWKIHT